MAPGILRMELPIQMPGLGHVNCYAVLDREGAAIVDPGLPGPGTWRVLQDRLRQAGLAVRHVHTVIVTHSHPDHFGGAARFAKEAGAAVVAHHSFRFGPSVTTTPHSEVSVDDLDARPDSSPADGAEVGPEPAGGEPERETLPLFAAAGRTPWGGERPRPPFRIRLKWIAMRMMGKAVVPTITRPVEHGDVIDLAGREWFVVHTPGHTADHFCLHDPETGIFLAGDHVLPTITPHISGIATSSDPLSSYFYSLDRVAEISGVERVLPAHGHPFTDLRARTEAIKRHHFERLEKLKDISREIGPATVQQFSQRLFRPRSWGAMAESETYAHLEHLRIAGDAERRVEKAGTYSYETG
jgi:glyoxylase-like metal-dependent hydrolase (beta-lactamase superfamily II)